MANFTVGLVGLAVLTAACVAERAPDPPALPGFGLVGCVVEPDAPGPSFRMTINDQSDQMIVRTSLSTMALPRDEELTDSEIHTAASTDGIRTIAVTLNSRLETTVTTINERVTIGSGQCEAL
jgi:hypothetical protein